MAIPTVRSDSELLEVNRRFYNGLWSAARLVEPQRFNTWPLVSTLVQSSASRLEVAPGLRPRLPLEGTRFVDISEPALAKLRAGGADAVHGGITALPFNDAEFDLLCAFDIIEHVDDDERALSELSRVAKPGAAMILSTPLHESYWTSFDDLVGHRRRYEPEALLEKLARHGFGVEQSAIFGMKPKSNWLVRLGMWFLVNRPHNAMRVYNRILMPLGIRFQKPLQLQPGLVPTEGVDEVLLVCRKRTTAV